MSQKTADIQHVFDAHASDIEAVERVMREMFTGTASIIPAVGNYLIGSGGKRIRPLFLLLSAALAGYREGDAHIRLGAVIEWIHTASLLHDDVVDGAESRRGKSSANATWGNQVVILVGDFMYSTALKMAVTFRDHQINESLSHATSMMTDGELKQLEMARDTGITEDEYFQIISAKTGALISSATQIGAVLGGADAERQAALTLYGLAVGNAFQVADDILDYRADAVALGKKLGKDLEEGKVTLPLIYLLRSASEAERVEITRIVEREELAADDLGRIMELMSAHGSIEEAEARAARMVDEAKERLLVFADCEARRHLYEIADYALMRKR